MHLITEIGTCKKDGRTFWTEWAIVEVFKKELPLFPEFAGYLAVYRPEEWVSQESGEIRYHGEYERPFISLDDAYKFCKDKLFTTLENKEKAKEIQDIIRKNEERYNLTKG